MLIVQSVRHCIEIRATKILTNGENMYNILKNDKNFVKGEAMEMN